MSLPQFLSTNRNAEGARNVSVPGCDSVMLPDETVSSLTDRRGHGVAETSTPRYSKRPSDKFNPHFSFVWIC